MKAKNQKKRNIQQHFVTAAYLAGFTPDDSRDSQLYVYERNTEKMFRAVPDKAAKRRNYYSIPLPDGGFDDTVDQMLTVLEDQAMPSLHKVLARDYELSPFERALLATLIAYQEVRTPWSRQMYGQMEEQLTTATMHIAANQPGYFEQIFEQMKAQGEQTSVTPDELREALREKRIVARAQPHASLPLVASMGLELGNIYTRMLWTIMWATESEFLTSDAPVIRRDVGFRGGFYGGGLMSPTAEVWFPLSKAACMVITHDQEGEDKYFKLLSAGRRSEAEAIRNQLPPIRERNFEQRLVGDVNQLTIRNANRFVFSPFESPEISAWLKGESQNMRIAVSPPPPIK